MEVSHDILYDIVVFSLKVRVREFGRWERVKIYMTHSLSLLY